jgi:O-6-methylguanine DNA methyltransferase
MNAETQDTDDRLIADGLTSLRQPAPAGLRGKVLASVGLDESDEYVQVEGPIGPLFVAYGKRGISLVERVDAVGDAGGFEESFYATFGRHVRRAQSAPGLVQKIIDARLWGRAANPSRMTFELDQLPDFERSVLLKVLEIPRGEVRPYAWVAAELGRPLAVRAVGNAVARNPIPFVIPCHRVVRSDGRIGNYGAGGPGAKRAVLAAEGVDVDELERLPNRGIRFIGSDTTHIYCYPSCRNARRVTDAHRVALHSADEARTAGYRACKVCRPVDPPFRAAIA